jgi:hypothetical protein
MNGTIIAKVLDFAEKCYDEQLRLNAALRVKCEIQTIGAVGCPGLEVVLCNKGNRTAKIASCKACVQGSGFVAKFDAGFENKLGHSTPEDPDFQKEIYRLPAFPLDKKNSEHGWVLDRDDIARFFLPIFEPLAVPIATHNPDTIWLSAWTLDDQEIRLVDGDTLQKHVQPVLDYARNNKLSFHESVPIEIEAFSEKFPSFGAQGTTNTQAIQFPVGEPWASEKGDFK